jgi:hypothetical protein
MAAVISEPDSGHILVETSAGLVTTFSVEPAEHGARHIDTVIDAVSQLRMRQVNGSRVPPSHSGGCVDVARPDLAY